MKCFIFMATKPVPNYFLGLSGFIGDSPEKAELNSLDIESGDIIVLATDGLWDNVPEHIIVEQLSNVEAADIQV